MPSSLLQVIERVRAGRVDESDWLFIAGQAERLTLDTDADFGCADIDEDTYEEIIPQDFVARGLQSTIDAAELEHCIEWADKLSGARDNNAALDVIRYYIRFDAWPDRLGAPDPPPVEEIMLRLDREYVDKLGEENSSKPCRREGCNRGAVKLSVLCRRHHFESVRKRPYPFDN